MEIVFPVSTAPGVNSTESGGRLINAYAEKAREGSRSRYLYRRAPGLSTELFATEAGHRGALPVGNVLYVVTGDKVYRVYISGGAFVSELVTGDAVPGTGPVFMARNMAATPNVLIVTNSGMSEIDTTTPEVKDFADGDLPQVNSIAFLDSYFLVTSAAGQVFASGINATSFAGTDFATAESDPDGLVRAIARDRDLLLMGDATTEFWANVGNPTGFPFTRGPVIPYGLFGPHAVAGHEPGWGNTPVFVANDRTVRFLDGYDAVKISTPELDRLLEAVVDPATLHATAYVAAGHAFWSLTSPDWTWVFDKTERTWHERQSYGSDRWRIAFCVRAFDRWLAFDRDSGSVYQIDERRRREVEAPLVWRVRSTQAHAFPSRLIVNRASFDFLTAVGKDNGIDPIETNPQVSISWSDDGGRTFGTPLLRRLGGTGEVTTVDIRRVGMTGPRGRQWELAISDPVEVVLMGAAMDVEVVG